MLWYIKNDMDKVKYYCVQLVTPDDSSDVTGVEIAVALKNVLTIAAGIMDRMNLDNNSMAALVAQGCSEIRWLATKEPGTACLHVLSIFQETERLEFEKLDDILSSMNQVAEGVSTAGAVIALAQKYNVKMPVLTAVAWIIDDKLILKKAVLKLMSLPQVF
ncbi:hypothetical protein QYF36_025197 [Acer negundo]|nr:hypothetical protein QYF36_025197 [Acer negundo]